MNPTNLVVDMSGISIDPEISDEFWSFVPRKNRPKDHLIWLGKPIILTVTNPHFPTGIRYDVYCLEVEGASERPALWGMFGTLEEAVQRAKQGPPWREQAPRSSGKSSKEVCEVPGNQVDLSLSETG